MFFELVASAFSLAVQIMLPILGVALVAGAIGGFLRVAFSIDDGVVSFVAKLVAVGFLIYLSGHVAWENLASYTQRIWSGADFYL